MGSGGPAGRYLSRTQPGYHASEVIAGEKAMFKHSFAACALACFAVAMTPVQTTAADIKMLSGTSMRVLLPELLPQIREIFRAQGHG